MSDMVERVAKALWEASEPGEFEEQDPGYVSAYRRCARAAIEAMPLEQLVRDAYVRGVEWNEENPLDREYRFKASADYADKVLSAALKGEAE